MVHCSGMSFEGLWINGRPSLLAHKLGVTNVEGPLEVVQGVPFSLEIECQNEDGQVVEGKKKCCSRLPHIISKEGNQVIHYSSHSFHL